MFEDATFHSRGVLPTQTPRWMLLTLGFNLSILATLIALPLIYPESLPNQFLRRALAIPTPPLAAQPQPRATEPSSTRTVSRFNPWVALKDLPRIIDRTPDNAPPPVAGINLPDSGPGSDRPADALFHSSPPPIVRQAAPLHIVISQGVAGGLLIFKTNPVYPQIAIATRTSGTVTLAATISKAGLIENLRVVSGPPLLRQAAINSVQQWRYHPYLLNNQPVEVETTINVVFSLGER